MAIEYRRMLLFGPDAARWEYPAPEVAERLLTHDYGVGGLGDQRNDSQQYWECRNGGAWQTHSYWPGSLDYWVRSRLMAVERLQKDQRLLRRDAQASRAVGGRVESIKRQVAQLEA